MKQRLIGAAVLIALAVIFLPMLIQGPAPEGGASDVPLQLPPEPEGGFETRELPLVAPAGAPDRDGALGMPQASDRLPTVDTTTAADPAAAPGQADDAGPGQHAGAADAPAAAGPEAGPEAAMTPPPVPGGDYAVSFGSYATRAGAARVVGALQASQLPGYQEAVDDDGRTLFRVRIGPYADRATAEAARLRAAHVRDDVGSKVLNIALAADEAGAGAAAAGAGAEPDASRPGARPETAAVPEPEPAAAADVGFALQIGAFGVEANAVRLRDRARELGLSSFVVAEPTAQGTLNVVKVGPVADRAAAEQLKAQVAARMGITGTIGSHP